MIIHICLHLIHIHAVNAKLSYSTNDHSFHSLLLPHSINHAMLANACTHDIYKYSLWYYLDHSWSILLLYRGLIRMGFSPVVCLHFQSRVLYSLWTPTNSNIHLHCAICVLHSLLCVGDNQQIFSVLQACSIRWNVHHLHSNAASMESKCSFDHQATLRHS